MEVKQFAQSAIQNGYTGSECKGWDWIRNNLSSLDDIFQSEEYKKCNGMKYKCMPLLLQQEELSQEEKSAIGTFWYLNNQRVHENRKKEFKNKMLLKGWIELTEDVIKKAFKDKNKVQITASIECDWLTNEIAGIFKPFVDNKGYCYIMKLRARSRGMSITGFKNAYCKII